MIEKRTEHIKWTKSRIEVTLQRSNTQIIRAELLDMKERNTRFCWFLKSLQRGPYTLTQGYRNKNKR